MANEKVAFLGPAMTTGEFFAMMSELHNDAEFMADMAKKADEDNIANLIAIIGPPKVTLANKLWWFPVPDEKMPGVWRLRISKLDVRRHPANRNSPNGVGQYEVTLTLGDSDAPSNSHSEP